MIANKNKIYQQKVDSLIESKIIDLIPLSYLDMSNIKFPEGIHLADSHFYKPSRVNIIIGHNISTI